LFACLLFIGIGIASAQEQTVTGRVTDPQGAAVEGANVIIPNTNRYAITDMDGKYSIKAQKGETLQFSCLSMKTQSIDVTKNIIDVVMQYESTMLEQAVVIGYGTAKKRDLTGSIASVSASTIADRPASNPLASLQGKVAGVQIVNTGRPGQDPEIKIRGTNSINGYAPLYIVDGVFCNNINFVNTADIERFEILKDPSSLAIFGVRGANGVIIVTTKHAREGQFDINFNTSYGLKFVSKKISLTNAAQFKELYNEQLLNMGSDAFDYTYYKADTDWQDKIFRTASVSNTTLSVSGATAKNNFYMGIGYQYEQGNIKSEEMRKLTFNFSDEYTPKEWLKLGYHINGSYFEPADAKNATSAIRSAPITPSEREPETNALYANPSFQRAQVTNPLYDTEDKGNHNIAKNYYFQGSAYGKIDFTRDLSFKATFSADYASNNTRGFTPYHYEYYPEEGTTRYISKVASVSQDKSNTLHTQSDYTLTYKKDFARKHHLTAMAGFSTNYTSYEYLVAGRTQNAGNADINITNNNDQWWISSISDGTTATNGSDQYNRFTMSFLMRALYNYNNRYLFNASYRRDGASVFQHSGNTWDNFYSFGAGWIASEENFLKNVDFLDFLKIKASYGVLGNQNTGSDGGYYPAYPTLTSSSAVFGDNIISAYRQSYLVTNLKWEKTYAWEAGFEAKFLKSRLSTEAVFYNKKTTDLIVYLQNFMGSQDGLTNSGDVRNRGVELSGTWSDKIGDLRYSVSGNLTTISNKVIKLGKTLYSGSNSVCVTEPGKPISYFYGYVVDGVYQNSNDIKESPVNTLTSVLPGDLKFRDVNGDGKITAADRTKIGNPTPDFTYGYSVNLGYKNFDLGIDFQGVYGNEIYDSGYTSNYAQFNYLKKRMGRWHGEGTSNWEPILDSSRSIQQENSSYYIEDGSYLRLKNLQLGYSFGQKLVSKLRLKALRIYMNVSNLHTWGHNVGYTPEIGGENGSAIAFGVDSGSTYPIPSIYTFGLNLTF
jgi:TonB-linked SusC/RagA family outer membrane protein